MMDFHTGAELLTLCQAEGLPIPEVMLRREAHLAGLDARAARERMHTAWEIMVRSARDAIREPVRSIGGLIGGEARRMRERARNATPVCGGLTARAVAYAIGVLETNASMGLIVAAPTAGASGVIPGTFLAVQEEFRLEDAQMVDALFHASAVGYLIMRNATVSGARGGCQAEVGSASAMAASAIAGLMGATPAQSLGAAAMALSNLLGLVCDPIGGLVEAPCQKRNAVGASNALVCAEMALCGVEELIPFDEMVEAMYQVGRRLPMELRETALGGVAATPTACRLCADGGCAG